MGRLLRGLAIVLSLLLILLVIGLLVIYFQSNSKLTQVHSPGGETLSAPMDAEAIALGEYLVESRGCKDCHGENLAGTVMINDPMFAYLPAPNLTTGGVGATYSDSDYANAIRRGIHPNGTALLIMPSAEFYYLNDTDTAAIIAYLKSLPPVENALGTPAPGPIMRMLLATNQFATAAELVEASPPRPAPVPVGATAEHGGYIANLCIGCHGMDLKGAPAGPGGGTIDPPDITPSGRIAAYDRAQFINAMRTGTRPDGSMISTEMPWQTIGKATDEDLTALYLYLSTLGAEGRTAPGQ